MPGMMPQIERGRGPHAQPFHRLLPVLSAAVVVGSGAVGTGMRVVLVGGWPHRLMTGAGVGRCVFLGRHSQE